MALNAGTAWINVAPRPTGWKGLGKAIAIAAPLAAVGAGAIMVGKKFHEMRSAIITGTGASGKALKSLEESAKRVGKQAPEDFKTIGEAIAEMNTATGATGKPLEDMTKAVLNASRLLGEDGVANSKAFGRALNQWNIPAKDGAKTVDSLFEATQKYGIGLGETTKNLSKYGGTLQNAGFEMDESVALFGRLSKGGIDLRRAMPGLNMAFRKWAEEGKNGQKELSKTIERMKGAETGAEALAIATETFGAEGAQQMVSAARSGSLSLKDLSKDLDDSAGSVTDADKRNRTFGESWQLLKNKAMVGVEPMATKIFDALIKGMEWLSNTGGPAMKDFGGYLQRTLGPTMQDIATWVRDDLVPAIKSLVGWIRDDATPAVRGFADWMKDNEKPIKTVAGAITVLFIPALISLGVAAVVAKIKVVASAIASAAAWVKAQISVAFSAGQIIGSWIAIGVAALRSAAQTTYVWALYKIEALKGALVHVRAAARVVGGWALMGAKALLHAGRVVAGWAMTGASAVKAGIKHAATAGLIIAKWAWMGVKAMLHAAKIAAAWLISMGPIGLVIAAVAGLTVVVVKNWDKIKAAIAKGWNWVKEISKKTWGAVTKSVSGAWDTMKDKTKTAQLWVIDKMLWFADKLLGLMAKAFGWAPGIGDKLKAAHNKVKDFRKDVNREMNAIKDENVKITATTQGFTVVKGKNGTPIRLPQGMAHGGPVRGGQAGRDSVPIMGMPGEHMLTAKEVRNAGGHGAVMAMRAALAAGGPNFRMGRMPNVAGFGESMSRGFSTAAYNKAARTAKLLHKIPMGATGPTGKVMRPGSYSTGMPYLGYPGHYGADYPASTGTPVFAMAGGIVARALSMTSSYGRHAFLNHPGGVETRYAHMNSLLVRSGQRVRAGQQIGTVGSTGNSTGPHLHFEYRRNGSPRNPAGLGIFDKGGELAPGMLALHSARIRKPDKVLTDSQFHDMHVNAQRGMTGAGRTVHQHFPITDGAAATAAAGRANAALEAKGI